MTLQWSFVVLSMRLSWKSVSKMIVYFPAVVMVKSDDINCSENFCPQIHFHLSRKGTKYYLRWCIGNSAPSFCSRPLRGIVLSGVNYGRCLLHAAGQASIEAILSKFGTERVCAEKQMIVHRALRAFWTNFIPADLSDKMWCYTPVAIKWVAVIAQASFSVDNDRHFWFQCSGSLLGFEDAVSVRERVQYLPSFRFVPLKLHLSSKVWSEFCIWRRASRLPDR